jgi:sugar (pentulose or hexulose) kinase
MVERPLVPGLDVRTQNLRAVLVDCNGRMVAFGVGGQPVSEKPGRVTQGGCPPRVPTDPVR